ncbi:MAG: hypothetical protein HZB30_09785 [Nitrospirae bacterium]|nr:hypothetical protein [Nitrospirota bacterium]
MRVVKSNKLSPILSIGGERACLKTAIFLSCPKPAPARRKRGAAIGHPEGVEKIDSGLKTAGMTDR